MKTGKLRIVFSSVLQDAGEATRALEIAKGIRQYRPAGWEAELVFLSRGSRFERNVLENDFSLYLCLPRLAGQGFHADLKPSAIDFIGDRELAVAILAGEIQALNALEPDVVIHGFWPIASLARRMLKRVVPGIHYLPIPSGKMPSDCNG